MPDEDPWMVWWNKPTGGRQTVGKRLRQAVERGEEGTEDHTGASVGSAPSVRSRPLTPWIIYIYRRGGDNFFPAPWITQNLQLDPWTLTISPFCYMGRAISPAGISESGEERARVSVTFIL